MSFDTKLFSAMIESSINLLAIATGVKAGETQVNVEYEKDVANISVVSVANPTFGTVFNIPAEPQKSFAFDPQTLLKIISGRTDQLKFTVDKALAFQCGRLKGNVPLIGVKSPQIPSATGTKLDRDALDTIAKAVTLCGVKGKEFDTLVHLSDTGISCYVAAMFQMGYFRQTGKYPKMSLSLPLTHIQALQKVVNVVADKKLSISLDAQKVVAYGKNWRTCFPTIMIDEDKLGNILKLADVVDKVKGGHEVDSKELQRTLSSVSAVADSEAYATLSCKDSMMTVEVVSSNGRVSDKLNIKAGKTSLVVRADPEMLAKALSHFKTPRLTTVSSPSLYLLREQLPDGTLTHVGAQVGEK